MKRVSRPLLIGAALVSGVTAPQLARAGGISLYEIGTPDVGLASAGYGARAQDASTLFKNPAGMSQLDGSQLQAGVQFLYGDVKFSPDANTSPGLGTSGGGNAIGGLPGASFFFVEKLSDQFAVGLGCLSYFGLMAKYDEDWVGRYYVQESALVGVSLMPSLSYKPNDWLSVGAGLNAMDGYLNAKTAINRPLSADGQMELKDTTWGFGANLGVLVEPWKGTRFGVTYLSAVKLDFQATPSFSDPGVLGGPAPQLDLGMKVPQSVLLSAYHELNERWALMADFGWQDWSQFGKVDVGVDPANGAIPARVTTASLHYQDTFHGAVGAQYQLCPDWQLTAGVAFDSSAVDSANRTITAPMGQAWRFGLGARWQVSRAVELGAAYEFLWSGDMAVNQGADSLPVALGGRGQVSGSYNDASFSFFTLNMTWKF
jgi:long-chain fatty acid transport protein